MTPYCELGKEELLELEEIYQSGHIADFTEVLYPEVKEILRWLKEQGLQIALASSSPVHCI